ncbi:MAG: DUF4199 domain-containing protein [Mediterranea sp.]|jgi:hypothetical protein|nr:DUF4199 domain-containing protein [Mediterranea sp.]
MTENRSYLQKYAMHFGTYMGVYWVLKFILFPLAFRIPFFQFLFVVLTLAVPFIGYFYVKIYRDKVCGGAISFAHAAVFCTIMYVSASLLVAVAHYVYFQFIDHGFLIDTFSTYWDQLMTQMPALLEHQDNVRMLIDDFRSASPIEITMRLFSSDIFWGLVLIVPTGLMVMRRPKQ